MRGRRVRRLGEVGRELYPELGRLVRCRRSTQSDAAGQALRIVIAGGIQCQRGRDGILATVVLIVDRKWERDCSDWTLLELRSDEVVEDVQHLRLTIFSVEHHRIEKARRGGIGVLRRQTARFEGERREVPQSYQGLI